MRRKWKKSKVILPLLLSAMMVVEPIGAIPTVYAEELTQSAVMIDLEQDEDEEKETDLISEEEKADQDAEDNTEESYDQTDDASEEGEEEDLNSDDTDQKEESVENPSETEEGEEEETDISEEEGLTEGGEDQTGENTVSGNELEKEPEEDQDDELGEFSGMPDDYQLSLEQKDAKRVLADKAGDIREDQEGIMYVKGEVMTLAASNEEAEMIAEAYNAKIKSFENGLLVLMLEKDTTVCDAINAAASSRTVLPAVWPNYYRYAYVEETDDDDEIIYEDMDEISALESYERAIASYDDPDISPDSAQYQWQHVAVGSPYAWKAGYTGAGVKVAVLDSGVASHPDLTIVDSVDKTGSGSASDVAGHGTHVAGIIGAKSNNIGGVGIAPDAELYNIRVLDDDGRGTDDMIWQGIDQAIKWDVDVINMSLGGPGYNDLLQQKVTEAYEEKGIAIFVAAGNDGVSAINYPACYSGIICVAATDTNNVRASFSTYGSWVDLSAPGINIWSTYLDGGYASLNGTSMACPVASGEAAVLLSSHSSLNSMEKSKAKVDALEKLMRSNAVKAAGSGMGAGVTSLTKAFKLTTASVKPQAPMIDIEYDSDEKQSVTVTITAPMGLNVYYTKNGKTPVFKNGVLDEASEAELYTKPFTISDSAKVTIKAIAVNESGVSSAVKTATKALTPYVTHIAIDGVKYVAKGKSVQLSATVTPTYATNKKLTWQIYKGEQIIDAKQDKNFAAEVGVSINASSGKVTASKTAQEGLYKVVAIAQDRQQIQASYNISVISAVLVKSAKFDTKSVTIELPTSETTDLSASFIPEATSADITLSAEDFKWTSSNTTIATVNDKGIVTPLKAGKVTITALANDSSGKKATCTVTVIQQAEQIEVSGASSLAVSKNVTFKANVLPANTTNKKVTWQLLKDGKVVDAKVDKAFASEVGVSINASGKVTASKNAKTGTYTVKAISVDNGQVSSNEAQLKVISDVIDKFEFSDKKDAKLTLYRKGAADTTETQKDIVVSIKSKGSAGDIDLDAYTVTNSNAGIATVTSTRNGADITLRIRATGNSAGQTKITIASTDGSNKKLVCTVNVVNPVSKIHIASNTITTSYDEPKVDMCVVQNKSIQLKATLESEYGAVSNKNVTWSIDAPAESGVKISSSGKVTANKTAPTQDASGNFYVWTVTATAKDGSGVKADYKVMAVPAATYVLAQGLYADSGIYKMINTFPQTPDVNGNQQLFGYYIHSDVKGGYVEASSSNNKIIEVTTNSTNTMLYVTPRKAGSATITLKTTDGSGVKITYRVKVTNEVYIPSDD